MERVGKYFEQCLTGLNKIAMEGDLKNDAILPPFFAMVERVVIDTIDNDPKNENLQRALCKGLFASVRDKIPMNIIKSSIGV